MTGEKSIESRFYKSRRAPWDKIKQGDTIYFKASGEDVYFRATVCWVRQFELLNKVQIDKIITEYGKEIAADPGYWVQKKDSKYAILIGLKDVAKIKPFSVKRCFGNGWVTVNDIETLKI